MSKGDLGVGNGYKDVNSIIILPNIVSIGNIGDYNMIENAKEEEIKEKLFVMLEIGKLCGIYSTT